MNPLILICLGEGEANEVTSIVQGSLNINNSRAHLAIIIVGSFSAAVILAST